MVLLRRDFVRLAVSAAAVPVLSRVACAQAFPTRPITIVVSFVAGGSGDTIVRILSERLRVSLGQPIIVENVSGASGSLGVGRVARAPPDGYTLSFGNWATHVLNGAVLALPYDVLKDFEPISLLVTESMLIVGRKTLPAHDLRVCPKTLGWIAEFSKHEERGDGGVMGPFVPAVVYRD